VQVVLCSERELAIEAESRTRHTFVACKVLWSHLRSKSGLEWKSRNRRKRSTTDLKTREAMRYFCPLTRTLILSSPRPDMQVAYSVGWAMNRQKISKSMVPVMG
jgi:hypothetical protein